MEKEIIKVQFGIFFNRLARPDLISSSIANQFTDIFDAPLINLPLPPSAPDKIPSSQLKSLDNIWNINISRIRLDIIFEPRSKSDYSSVEEINKMKEIIKFCHGEIKKQSSEINRATNIAIYVSEQENPAEFISKAFAIKTINNLKELKIRFNQKEINEKFEINNITDIESKELIKKENTNNTKKIKALFIVKDVNTVQNKEKKFSEEELDNFFEISKEYISFDSIKSFFE